MAQSFDLSSNQFEVGAIFTRSTDLLFDLAIWEIRPEASIYLDSIGNFLQKHDSLVVEIGIHTDTRVFRERSVIIEQKRAESIQEYLIEYGIDPERLSARGYGEEELIISDEEIEEMQSQDEKEVAHAVNRRMELKIIALKNKSDWSP